MISFVVVLVGAFLLGVKFTADLVKTRPRKCNVLHHLGVPTVATSDQSNTHVN
jgi:hypothetical protein